MKKMKKMKKFILTFFVAIYTFGMVGVAQNLNSPINNDPNVKIGKLDNGLTYYIRKTRSLKIALNSDLP